ncbi:amino acid racemase [Patescibacteria group bacterium]|nr:amino acid racemase [Patescibacteria group bacterium]MBU4367398.1 amino acid racemase [Patescibacteria group bacterium]MBU4461718.1 amino acid racemase [Patescibacteria group bacterium]MCG2700102.1 amino acid racemase [Candidatus Parcubacteria bacterium]
MKTVGIIGGVGPETTSEFYSELILQCQNLNNTNRPPILIYSIPLPYDVEEDAIVRGMGEERYVPLLTEAAQKLEKAGADFLVMPCNTLHVFIEDIRNSVNIPALSIVEETTKFLKEKNISNIGVLSTEITLKKKIYESYFLKNNIKQVLPDNHQQKKIGEIIYNLVMNKHSNKDKEELIEIINTFKEKGLKNILLACTDLQLITPQDLEIKIYDTMKIFADATVREILKD